MEIEEIISSNDLRLMKQHLRKLYDNYSIAIKREVRYMKEKIELLEEIENLKKSKTFYCAHYENSGLKKCDKMCITCDENINK